MSQIAYNALWADAMSQLGKLQLDEEPLQVEVKPTEHFNMVAEFYVRYVQALRSLEEAYDQIVHPQKRLLLRQILDGVIGRVLELKSEMVELEASEYHYLDNILAKPELKLSPAELEIPIPNYFTVDRRQEIADRRALLADIHAKIIAEAEAAAEAERIRLEEEAAARENSDEEGDDDDDDDDVPAQPPAAAEGDEAGVPEEEKPPAAEGGGENGENAEANGKEKQMSKKEKEREKQEKLKRKEQERLQRLAEKERQEKEEKERVRRANMDRSMAAKNRAAITIQSLCRGYIDRKATTKLRKEELAFLGMEDTVEYTAPEDNVQLQATKALRREKQQVHRTQYELAIVTITDELWRVEAVTMAEAMKTEIREWINDLFTEKGFYPEYPDEEDGGSLVIVEEKRLANELAAGLEAEDKKEPKDGKKDGKKDDKKGKDEGDAPPDLVHLKASQFLEDIGAGNTKFDEVWRSRDEAKNFIQKHEDELIREMQRKVVEPELRVKVDVDMRLELEELERIEQERLLAEAKGKKGKGGKGKGKKGKGKKGKDKKGKGAKGGKKKKEEVDLTADRPLEELYEELVREGLLIKSEPVKMRDYLGDYSYLGKVLRDEGEEVKPSLSDVRQVLTLFGILPLGSQEVHEKAPLVKSIFLTGPTGVGKKMLVHAVCQEVGANLFDLSPQNILGHYPGPDGLAMMLHMVFKVARRMQPSVVWIGDADKMFNKKVAKEDKDLDVKRLKKDLPKVVKGMKAGERVLILGTSRDPTGTDIKGLAKVYGKILIIPGPDYSSRFLLWKQLIKKKGGVVTSALDISALSTISEGFTPGLMLQVIGSVLTEARLQELATRPLTAEEFVEPLSKTESVVAAEKLLMVWDTKTPLGKKRAKAAKEREEAAAEKAKGKK